MQDFTVMKLMEEIVEFDQEIKMKQKWINSRMKLLHKIQEKQTNKEMKSIIHTFMQKLQPEYPEKLSVDYKREGETIPLNMADRIPDPVPMHMADKYMNAIPMSDQGPKVEEINES